MSVFKTINVLDNIGIGISGNDTNTVHIHKPSASTENYIQLTNSSTGDSLTDGAQFGVNSSNNLSIKHENKEICSMDSAGNLAVGESLATTATDGFLYTPSTAGLPTGVPTTKTGLVPTIYDTTNDKVYTYNSGWKPTGGTSVETVTTASAVLDENTNISLLQGSQVETPMVFDWRTKIGSAANEEHFIASGTNSFSVLSEFGSSGNDVSFFDIADPPVALSDKDMSIDGSALNLYVANYDLDGNLNWRTKIGSTASLVSYGINMDSSDNIYVSFRNSSNSVFYDTADTPVTVSNDLAYASSIHKLAKYNSSGVLQWRTHVINGGSSVLYSITSDSSDNIYMIFKATGSVNFYDTQEPTPVAVPNKGITIGNGTYYALCSYTSAGVFRWRTLINPDTTTTTYGLNYAGTDTSDAYYVSIVHNDTINFYNTADTTPTVVGTALTQTATETALIKYDTNGVLQWRVKLEGPNLLGSSVTVLGDDVYLSCKKNSTIVFYDTSDVAISGKDISGTFTGFLAKYNSSGVLQWRTAVDGVGNDNVRACTSGNSHVVIGGRKLGANAIEFFGIEEPTPLTVNKDTTSNEGWWFAAYDSDGVLVSRSIINSATPPSFEIGLAVVGSKLIVSVPADVITKFYDGEVPNVLLDSANDITPVGARDQILALYDILAVTNYVCSLPSVSTTGTRKNIILNNAVASDLSISNLNDTPSSGTWTFNNQGDNVEILSDGTNWNIINTFGVTV